jgi:hypothetical protein
MKLLIGFACERFGIGRRIGELARKAARACPSLRGRTVTPHRRTPRRRQAAG